MDAHHFGWLKLYRSLTLNDEWLSERFTHGQAWVDLLLLAKHKATTVRIRGVLVELAPGQVALSEKFAAARWRWSRGKIRRCLKTWENGRQIVQQKTNVTTVVTILNWAEYQGNGTASETPNRTADGHQTGQQTDTHKNGKNGENGKNGKTTSPAVSGGQVESLKLESPDSDPVLDAWEWFLSLTRYHGLPVPRKLTPERKRAIKARIRDGLTPEVRELITIEVEECDFLRGIGGNDGWKGVDFDFLFMRRGNWLKVAEKKYRNKLVQRKHTGPNLGNYDDENHG